MTNFQGKERNIYSSFYNNCTQCLHSVVVQEAKSECDVWCQEHIKYFVPLSHEN